ncbi:hypothetical protein [Cedratvirus kamchatka]|uniref:Uncharacterized protein n=1 Tax=Cedratvirus kamchatka TaxID=2716914 RepID=A0A6G8MYD5_9VIRU|nr:hypothetical protein [Cedratvirus kamchatka]
MYSPRTKIMNGTFATFWREKFETSNLPLLEEGKDFTHWSKIYERSVQAARVADEKIDSGEAIEIALSRIDNLDLLKVTDLDQDTWEMIRTNNLDSYLSVMQEESIVIHDYYLLLTPRASFYLYEKIDKQGEINEQSMIQKTLLVPSSRIALTRDDAWILVYRLVYFGYVF